MPKLTISDASSVMEHESFLKWLRENKNIFLAEFVTDDKSSTEVINNIDPKKIRKLAIEFVEKKYNA